MIEGAGLAPNTNGDGVVSSQEPVAGTLVASGSTVAVRVKGQTKPPSAQEHIVGVAIIKSLRDDAASRDGIRNLLNEIKNAVDDDATHIQINVTITTPTGSKDKLIARAAEAGITAKVTDL